MPAAEHNFDLELPSVSHIRPTGRATLTGSPPKHRPKNPQRPARVAKWTLRDGLAGRREE